MSLGEEMFGEAFGGELCSTGEAHERAEGDRGRKANEVEAGDRGLELAGEDRCIVEGLDGSAELLVQHR